jgi:hypothetical protein
MSLCLVQFAFDVLSSLLRFSGLTDTCPTDKGFVYKAHVSLCFKYHTDKSSYTQAVSGCIAEGTTLIKIDSADKNKAVYDHISSMYSRDISMVWLKSQDQIIAMVVEFTTTYAISAYHH